MTVRGKLPKIFLLSVFLPSFLLLLPFCHAEAEGLTENEHTLAGGPLSAADAKREADFIGESVRAHEQYAKNRMFFDDTELEKYLDEIAEPFIRALGIPAEKRPVFKILRNPTLNAVTTPAGFIYYHSGILARTDNEAQLAFILGHEISHLFHRDFLSEDLTKEIKKKKFKVLDALMGELWSFSDYGEPNREDIEFAYIIAMGGFKKEQEARADLFAVEQMVKLGYDPNQAVQEIDNWDDETDRYDPEQVKDEVFFYSDHPSNAWRKKALKEWISKNQALIQQYNATKLNASVYLKATYSARQDDVKLNLDWNRDFQAKDRAIRLIQENPGNFYACYYLGEALRGALEIGMDNLQIRISKESKWRKMTDEEKSLVEAGFKKQAMDAYTKALEFDPKFALPYRGLGLYSIRQDDLQAARHYFEKYLEMAPHAKDRRSILYYIDEIAAGRKPS